MVTNITSKSSLDGIKSTLLEDVKKLKETINNINLTLRSVPSYENLYLTTAGNKLAGNFNAVYNDIDITSKNISNYIDKLKEIDEDTDGIVTLESISVADTEQTNEEPISKTEESITEEMIHYESPQNDNTTPEVSNPPISSEQTNTPVNNDYQSTPNNETPSENTTPQQPVTDSTPVETEPSQEVEPTPVVTPVESNIDLSRYSNLPEKGFNVTTGNTTYELSSSDFDLLCAIVAAESDKSFDDALAVVTTILNRCEAPNWVASFGTNPIKQATAPNQFVVYQHGSYKSYLGNAPDAVKQAVSDALAGVRNHNYLSFRSNGSKKYSSNMITPTGNRYK